MYCASCGVAVAQSLSYCNYCGAKLTGTKSDGGIRSREIPPEFLMAGMVFVFVFGLAAITVLMGVMKSVLNLNVGQILPLAFLSFLLWLVLESIFIFLLLRRKRGAVEVVDTTKQQHTTKELHEAQKRSLPEPALSVTDHTTRTLEPVYRERKTQ